jgi:hypothetical protein
MTEQLKYRAKINAKGLDTTGVTEDHARKMAAHLGSHHLFVVEARAATVLTDEEGNQQVALVLTQVEPVPGAQEDTVREFLRALYRQRPDQQGQAVLRGTDDGLSVADAASALSAQVDRGEDGEVEGVWDGSTDGPLPDLPDSAYPEGAEDLPEPCPHPDCILPEDHDGDHEPEVAEPADGSENGGHVVEFSGAKGKGKRA